MPPQDCIDKGCHARMTMLEEQVKDIENPATGALGQLHTKINAEVDELNKKIDGKTSHKIFWFIVTASFTFTSLCSGALFASRQAMFDKQDQTIKDANDVQNRRIEETLGEVRAMRIALSAAVYAANAAKDSIDEHRAITEGRKRGR